MISLDTWQSAEEQQSARTRCIGYYSTTYWVIGRDVGVCSTMYVHRERERLFCARRILGTTSSSFCFVY